jgi:hypothetical protein
MKPHVHRFHVQDLVSYGSIFLPSTPVGLPNLMSFLPNTTSGYLEVEIRTLLSPLEILIRHLHPQALADNNESELSSPVNLLAPVPASPYCLTRCC